MNSFLDSMVKLVKEIQVEQDENPGKPKIITLDKYNEISISHNIESREQKRI